MAIAQSKRDVLIDSALGLFKTQGINTTGIELIIRKANVSKKTLYHHFKSKDELVLAALRKDDELGRNALMQYAESASIDPKQKILAIFDFYEMWFKSKSFRGCLFTNSAAELSEQAAPAKSICAEHKQRISDFIRQLAQQAGAPQPDELAWQINLLLEGAIVYAWVVKDKEASLKAKKMAQIILDTAF